MATISTLTDDFNAGSVDTTTRWSIFTSNASVTQSSGNLVITANSSGSGTLSSKTTNYTLAGSYALLQLVNAGTRNANTSFQLTLFGFTGASVIWWELNNTTLKANWDNGAGTATLATATYSSSTHQWLRIRESSGTIFWDYSSDGQSWTNFATLSTASLTDTTFDVEISNLQNGAGTNTVQVDNFNVLSPSIAQVAGNATASGSVQTIAGKNIVTITQSAATVTASGGTQAVTAANATSIAQTTATVTATGGAQTITAGFVAMISQVAGSVTASGGTQAKASVQNISIAQTNAAITASTGAQSIQNIKSVLISQSRAVVTATTGVQVLSIKNSIAITQIAALARTTGGLQAITTQKIKNWTIHPVTGASYNVPQTGGSSSVPTAGRVESASPPSIGL